MPVGSRSCRHGERRPKDHGERRPKDHGERRPKDHGGRRRWAHRDVPVDDLHSCHHGQVRASGPDDRAPVGAQHPNTNPRCRRRRLPRPNRSQNRSTCHSATMGQSAHRPDADENPSPWPTPGRGEATHPWGVRSSVATIRSRSRNSTEHHPIHRLARRRRNATHRNRHRRRNHHWRSDRRSGATCRRSSVPPALRPRAILALSCSRPDRSSRRDPG
jgi:hypothetical protein